MNPCGYEVVLGVDSFNNIVFISILSEDDSAVMSFNTWKELGLVLSDVDLLDKYSRKFDELSSGCSWDEFANIMPLRGVLS